MSLPFEISNLAVVTEADDEIVALDVPGRMIIDRLIVITPEAASTVDVFSRAFTSAQVNLHNITSDAAGKAQLNLAAPLLVNVGDLLTVADNAETDYNVATHRVLSVSADDKTIVTSEGYVDDGDGGTVELAIPAAEQELYRVLATQTASSNLISLISAAGFTFHNQDPRTKHRGQIGRKIYLKLGDDGAYRITIGGRHPEAFG